MKKEYEEELKRLTPRQQNIVLKGLRSKLDHYHKTQKISYRFDVCPVCKDMSVKEKSGCDSCYIYKSCQAPFTDGFLKDHKAAYRYFSEMEDFIRNKTWPLIGTRIIGGNWDKDGGRKSGVVGWLARHFNMAEGNIHNGGTLKRLQEIIRSPQNLPLTIWMPNISNDEKKIYPRKGTGNILICSKVMRPGYKRADAVSRIFKMHANAVIEIHSQDRQTKYKFALVDALGNEWCSTTDCEDLVRAIMKFYLWTKASIRIPSKSKKDPRDLPEVLSLTRWTNEVAKKVQSELGERYFGNISTRCQSLFPGTRQGPEILISPRNINKKTIAPKDLIRVTLEDGKVLYEGNKKPSVDAPIQLTIFAHAPTVNYIIHGHAKIKGAPTTENYYPCGDLREAFEVLPMILKKPHVGTINLKNHGFIIYAGSLDLLRLAIEFMEIEAPN